MYEKLGGVTLKNGEGVELGVVVGPDLDWAERIDGDLLAHKGPMWRWGNQVVLREAMDLEAYFYILHRNGAPFANVMTIEYQGVGILGHVFTRPEDRRQGAASLVFAQLMPHFRARGGQALILGTGYDSPPYHIYRSFGFESLEPESGKMAYYSAGEAAFRKAYFAPGDARVDRLGPAHYAAAPALFSGAYPGVVRAATMRLFGRCSTEGPLLGLLRDELARTAEGKGVRTAALRLADRPAVAGLATWGHDATWPNTCVVDVFCHPDFWARGVDLLQALDVPEADRIVAYCDAGWTAKAEVLDAAGFKRLTTLDRWLATDQVKSGFVDVDVWAKA